MMIPKNMHSKTVAILGLGISGIAAKESLIKAGSKLYMYDDLHNLKNLKNCKITHPLKWPWESLDEIIVSPGINVSKINPHPVVLKAKNKKVKISNEIDLFARSKPKSKIIGITGTNGKSSTTAMIGHILKKINIPAMIGGNIGKAATDLSDPGEKGYIILELSSYQLELCSELKLDAGVILNISSDHIEKHGSFNGYVNAKKNIYRLLKKDAPLLIGQDDNSCNILLHDLKNLGINVSKIPKNKFKDNKISKEHNIQNIQAAIKLLSLFGIKEKLSYESLISYESLPHRLESFLTFKNFKFINDSKSTNGESAKNALESFNNIFWIAGGRSKSEGLLCLNNELNNVKKCYLIGECAKLFEKELNNRISRISICLNLKNAINELFDDLIKEKSGIVLFSPAASSFDQYNNFEDRGRKFKSLVSKVLEKRKHLFKHANLGAIS